MARTWTLGLMLPNLTNPLYAAIARAAERRAQERGFGLVFGTHVEGEEEATFTRLLQQGRVDGLLTASGVLGDAFIRRFADGEQGPVVMLNRRVRGVRAAVTVDDAAGAALAVRHLAESRPYARSPASSAPAPSTRPAAAAKASSPRASKPASAPP